MKDKIFNFIKKYHSAVIIIALCFIFDLITKNIVVEKMYKDCIVVIDGFFNLTYCENTGAAWSMMSGNRLFFIAISLIATGVFIYYLKYYDLKKYTFLSLGICLMFGGMLGNFFDRIVKGYVVDFLDFVIFGYDYPVFNVADICLVVGVISLIIHLLISIKTEKENQKALLAKQEETVLDGTMNDNCEVEASNVNNSLESENKSIDEESTNTENKDN